MEGIGLPIVLLLVGVIAFFLEAFIPSGGAITVVGLGCVVGAIVTAFTNQGALTGTVFLALATVLVPVSLIAAFALLPRTAIGKRLTLKMSQKQSAGYVSQNADEQALLGQTGVAVSMLRPSGEAKIGDRRYDVVTEGEMLAKGTPIEVRRVEGNRIVVREVKSESDQA
ncbi:MAG: NfeD family protein [Planctomycetota bacterium]